MLAMVPATQDGRRGLRSRTRRDEGARAIAPAALLFEALRADPVGVRGACRLEIDGTGLRLIVEPPQHALVSGGGQHVGCGELEAAPHRHQHEQMECVGADLEREI